MKYYLKYIIQKLIVLTLLPFHLFPIHKNRILFLSLEGGSSYEYSCNPKYFCEYILEKCPDTFEPVWLFRHPENYAFLQDRGIRIARHFTPRGIYYALTSRIVISNGGYLTWFPFRKKQIRINTWHGGGAYKRLENDMTGANSATKKRMEYASRNTTAYLSSGREFSRHVIQGAFLYTGEILPIGMPRNDIFFSDSKETFYKSVRQNLHLSDNSRILLYAPTFRSDTGQKGQTLALQADNLLQQLTRLTGEQWYLLYRMHIQAGPDTLLTGLTDHCIDVSSYPDTQHLLCAADWLITDYSSIVWDYSLTDRPLLLYTPDLEAYCEHRGFYVDIHDWGFPICRSMKELSEVLPQILSGTYKNGPKHHQEILGSYESGHSCEALLDYLKQKLNS